MIEREEAELLETLVGNDKVETVTLYFPTIVWHFPKDPFVIYESTDEAWCRALGIGYEVEVEGVFEIPRALVSISRDGEICIQALSEIISTNVEAK